MNKVILIGNLTHDPELSELNNGTKMCRFTLAVNRDYKNASGQYDTDFLNCQAWRSTAENLVKYMSKGRKIAVTGSIQVRTYEKDDEKRTAWEIQVSEIEFISSPQQGGGKEKPATARTPDSDNIGYENPEDLPF